MWLSGPREFRQNVFGNNTALTFLAAKKKQTRRRKVTRPRSTPARAHKTPTPLGCRQFVLLRCHVELIRSIVEVHKLCRLIGESTPAVELVFRHFPSLPITISGFTRRFFLHTKSGITATWRHVLFQTYTQSDLRSSAPPVSVQAQVVYT